jgi:hypothetical protein
MVEKIMNQFIRNSFKHLLPKKFNIDKRKMYLSALICSGVITREDALKELGKNICDEEILKSDKEYVCKKLGITEEQLDKYMIEQ